MKRTATSIAQGHSPDESLRRVVRLTLLVFMATTLLNSFPSLARENAGVYLSQEDFLSQTYPQGVPEVQVVWVTGELKEAITDALGHDLGRLRMRYWDDGEQTAWVLEEIGQEELITVGITVRFGIIDQLHILVYREHRGWEVRLPFFTRQFFGITLNGENALTHNIDGISGATISVNVVKALAKVSILLDQRVQAEKSDG